MRQHFRLHAAALFSLTLLAIPALRADVTLNYKTEIKFNPSLPQQMTQQALKGMDASLPTASMQQFRNGKVYYSSGKQTSFLDFNKQEITMLDTEGKRYATFPIAQLADAMSHAMPEMPAEAKAGMAAIKAHTESTATGRTATIQGIDGEERQIVMTIDGPAMPNVPAGPMIRMVMHFWTAKASEAARVPAVREVAGYNLYAIAVMNPASFMEKAFHQMPGFADTFSALMKDMQSGGTNVLLRMQADLFMPMIGALMKQMPADNNPFGAGFGPDTPLMQITQELAGISTASVPDSLFQVPEGYKSAPAADLLKDIVAKSAAAPKQ